MEAFAHNFLNINVLIRTHGFLITGLFMTLRLIGFSLILAMAWGLFLSVVRNVHLPGLNTFIVFYVDTLRSLPILVLLMLIYYALPFVGIQVPAFTAAVLALSLNGGAYYAEIFRAGIEAIHRGQTEAARTLGLNYIQTMRHVILPQAIRVVLPPLTTNTLEFIKATAAASVVALPDILRQASQAMNSTFNPTPLTGALVLYLLICLPLVQLIRRFENN
ncbi:amino acid ABC transporter permease [Candidatus Bipolaricaulota bacterium]|nr:amino acid ABC transporter permease [Candidatus Bipolaricaulota bacterium]